MVLKFRLSLTVAAALAAATVSGCSPTDEQTPPIVGTSPPAQEEGATTAPVPPGESDNGFVVHLVRCLRDKGWDTDIAHDGSYFTTVPEEQADQYDTDIEDCQTEIGWPTEALVVTQKEAEDLYDTLLEVATCMRGLGYDVPGPPSKQAFVEQLTSHPIPEWHPYDVVFESGSLADVQRVETECPVAEP